MVTTAPGNQVNALITSDTIPSMTDVTTSDANGMRWDRHVRSNGKVPPHSLYRHPKWFTGKAPVIGSCPGINDAGIIASLAMPDLASSSRVDMLDYFDNTWTMQETLFAGLWTKESFYRRPDHKLRHPMIFYYGHPAAFYINKFRVAGLISKSINAHLEAVLEVGVDENSWDDLSKDDTDWPAIEEVHSYRAAVYELVRDVISQTDFGPEKGRNIIMDDPEWAIVMAFEHDRIHFETSSVLMRELPADLVSRHPAWPAPCQCGRNAMAEKLQPENNMISVQMGDVILGKPRDFPSFGWDNEYGHQRLTVNAFAASRYLITNGEFHQFVIAGGYRDKKYWSEDGWGQLRLFNRKWPRFWMPDGPAGLHAYRLRTIFDIVPMAWDWPVCVNYHEAKAYCTWRGEKDGLSYRIMTEGEAIQMRDPVPDSLNPNDDIAIRHGGHELARKGVNLNLAFGSETPVDMAPLNSAGFGDTIGNVWQWCEDQFGPLDGFAVHPYYEDFSTPFYEGQHQLLLGGSFIATGDEASIWGRIPFRKHFLQHSGIRLVRSLDSNDNMGAQRAYENGDKIASAGLSKTVGMKRLGNEANATTTKDELSLEQHILLHYGTLLETTGPSVPSAPCLEPAYGFISRLTDLILKTSKAQGLRTYSFLDASCGVGGAVFALSKHFEHVVGIDQREDLIEVANHMRIHGSKAYERPDCQSRMVPLVAVLDCSTQPGRTTFMHAQSRELPKSLEAFDVVLLGSSPGKPALASHVFINRLTGSNAIVRRGGLLVVSGDFFDDNPMTLESHTSGSSSGMNLLHEYGLLRACDVPMLVRTNDRSFRYLIPRVSIWQRLPAT